VKTERSYELAFGIRTHKNPTDMTRHELEDALFDIADFASRKLSEVITLRRIIENNITK
jgi:hypothetical protein